MRRDRPGAVRVAGPCIDDPLNLPFHRGRADNGSSVEARIRASDETCSIHPQGGAGRPRPRPGVRRSEGSLAGRLAAAPAHHVTVTADPNPAWDHGNHGNHGGDPTGTTADPTARGRHGHRFVTPATGVNRAARTAATGADPRRADPLTRRCGSPEPPRTTGRQRRPSVNGPPATAFKIRRSRGPSRRRGPTQAMTTGGANTGSNTLTLLPTGPSPSEGD
jgi:hypothetical protein